jgi:hypothetical protein
MHTHTILPLNTRTHTHREVLPGDPDAHLPLHGPNQWPSAQLLPGFKAAVSAYFQALTDLGHRLLRLLALALDLPGGGTAGHRRALHSRADAQHVQCVWGAHSRVLRLGVIGQLVLSAVPPPTALAARSDSMFLVMRSHRIPTLLLLPLVVVSCRAGDFFAPMFDRPMIALRPLHYSDEVSACVCVGGGGGGRAVCVCGGGVAQEGCGGREWVGVVGLCRFCRCMTLLAATAVDGA